MAVAVLTQVTSGEDTNSRIHHDKQFTKLRFEGLNTLDSFPNPSPIRPRDWAFKSDAIAGVPHLQAVHYDYSLDAFTFISPIGGDTDDDGYLYIWW